MWFQSAQWAFLWDVFTRCVFCGVGSFNLTFDECSIQQWYYPAFFAAGSYLAGFFLWRFFIIQFLYSLYNHCVVVCFSPCCTCFVFWLWCYSKIVYRLLYIYYLSSSIHLLFVIAFYICCFRTTNIVFAVQLPYICFFGDTFRLFLIQLG